MKKKLIISTLLAALFLTGCPIRLTNSNSGASRTVMFIGMDISGSFMSKWYYNSAVSFLSYYIYTHLQGYSGIEIPSELFVGSIGGAHPDEPKTFFPIQTFQYRSVKEIEKKLREIFPRNVQNPFTDYDAFFKQVSEFVRSKSLVSRPITIVMLTDGVPDAPKKNGKHDFRSIKLQSLETLARDITLRVLYTSASIGMNWREKVPRQRVKVWTQDANVMKMWNDPKILLPNKPLEQQERFFSWLKDNVDYKVAKKRVQ